MGGAERESVNRDDQTAVCFDRYKICATAKYPDRIRKIEFPGDSGEVIMIATNNKCPDTRDIEPLQFLLQEESRPQLMSDRRRKGRPRDDERVDLFGKGRDR